jgi:ABC-type transport system involved in multi-copper enzyme maturation permease subunit
MTVEIATGVFISFLIQFVAIFLIFTISLLTTAAVFKTKEYSLELVLLGLISFSILMLISEFGGLIFSSSQLTQTEITSNMLIYEMFFLMAATLIFSIGVVKNKLEKVKFSHKK